MKRKGVECGKCWYWHQVKEDSGECRVNPPISIPNFGNGKVGQWLVTSSQDWCGNFKVDKPQVRMAQLR